MARNLGISLLLLGLLAAGVDGFRSRDRMNPTDPETKVRAAEGIHIGVPPARF